MQRFISSVRTRAAAKSAIPATHRDPAAWETAERVRQEVLRTGIKWGDFT